MKSNWIMVASALVLVLGACTVTTDDTTADGGGAAGQAGTGGGAGAAGQAGTGGGTAGAPADGGAGKAGSGGGTAGGAGAAPDAGDKCTACVTDKCASDVAKCMTDEPAADAGYAKKCSVIAACVSSCQPGGGTPDACCSSDADDIPNCCDGNDFNPVWGTLQQCVIEYCLADCQ